MTTTSRKKTNPFAPPKGHHFVVKVSRKMWPRNGRGQFHDQRNATRVRRAMSRRIAGNAKAARSASSR